MLAGFRLARQNAHTNANSETHSNTYRNMDTNPVSNFYPYGHAHSDPIGYAGAYPDPYEYGNANTKPDTVGNSDAVTKPERFAHCDPDIDSGFD